MKNNSDIIYQCAVNGILGRKGKLIGVCPSIGTVGNRCCSEEQCQHQVETLNEETKEEEK